MRPENSGRGDAYDPYPLCYETRLVLLFCISAMLDVNECHLECVYCQSLFRKSFTQLLRQESRSRGFRAVPIVGENIVAARNYIRNFAWQGFQMSIEHRVKGLKQRIAVLERGEHNSKNCESSIVEHVCQIISCFSIIMQFCRTAS